MPELVLTDDSLQVYVEAVSEAWFHKPFNHQATFELSFHVFFNYYSSVYNSPYLN